METIILWVSKNFRKQKCLSLGPPITTLTRDNRKKITYLSIGLAMGMKIFEPDSYHSIWWYHYTDVTMSPMASQITCLGIVYSTVYSGADQRKHQSSASLAFVRRIHRGPVNSPHKRPDMRKMFPFDDVIMCGLVKKDQISKPLSEGPSIRNKHGVEIKKNTYQNSSFENAACKMTDEILWFINFWLFHPVSSQYVPTNGLSQRSATEYKRGTYSYSCFVTHIWNFTLSPHDARCCMCWAKIYICNCLILKIIDIRSAITLLCYSQ